MDTSTLANYRPISNLPFISKVLEKIVLVQINSFLEQTNILEVFQSGFRKYHSTETALTKIISDLRQNSDANKDKTEVLLIGPKLKREMLIKNLGGLTRWIKPEVISLGVILDSDLNFNSHINKVTKTAFFHLRNIAKVRPFINQNDAEKLIHAFISSRLDYCNSLFAGLPKKTTERLQLIQNSAARLLTKTKRREHISPVLATLHWLPVTFRIDFKVLLLTYKALNGQGPSYIANSLTNYTPARTLRSSDTGLLQVTRSSHKKIGDAAFVNYAPKLWNTLPINIREANTLDTFKKQLKTFLFTKAFY